MAGGAAGCWRRRTDRRAHPRAPAKDTGLCAGIAATVPRGLASGVRRRRVGSPVSASAGPRDAAQHVIDEDGRPHEGGGGGPLEQLEPAGAVVAAQSPLALVQRVSPEAWQPTARRRIDERIDDRAGAV